MKQYDAVIVGGGILGCFAARELSRYALSVLLLEGREDVCTGISKANTAIVYPGFDHKPGTLKAEMTRRANEGFGELCAELDVPFHRCGALMVSFGERGDKTLRKKHRNGEAMGVPGLRLIGADEARELEPSLSREIYSALYSPMTGTVDPWALCYAAYENASANGCETLFNAELLSIRRSDGGYILQTTTGKLFTRTVVNCAGLHADRVHEMLFEPCVRIRTDAADYLIADRAQTGLRMIVQHESEHGKGLTAVPTVDGGVLLGPNERECGESAAAVESEGLEYLYKLKDEVLPELPFRAIRSFAAVRPNPYTVIRTDGGYASDGGNLSSFVIEAPEPGFMSFIGIKTPGLTCSRELGAYAAEHIAGYLHAERKTDFDPTRRGIVRVRELDFEVRCVLAEHDPDYAQILCRCGEITRGEVLEAIRRGAVTLDGVKRRCGVMLGECQGARCRYRIMELLAEETGCTPEELTQSGGGSYIIGRHNGKL